MTGLRKIILFISSVYVNCCADQDCWRGSSLKLSQQNGDRYDNWGIDQTTMQVLMGICRTSCI